MDAGEELPRVARPGRRRGFTLTEVLVVVAVLALLAALLVPYFSRAYAVVRKNMCQNNLARIGEALHMGRQMELPAGYEWMGAALYRGSPDMLWCAEDDRDLQSGGSADVDYILNELMGDVYILQYHYSGTQDYDVSYLKSILSGGPVNDPQIWCKFPAGGIDQPPRSSWPAGSYPTDLKDNQAFIGIDNDSAVRITFGYPTVIEPMLPPEILSGENPRRGYSRHWVIEGVGTPVNPLAMGGDPGDEDDNVLAHLYGVDNADNEVDPPVSLMFGSPSSYGINGYVEAERWGPRQLLVMDANTVVVDPEENTWDELRDDLIRARHMDKVNAVRCDGSVGSFTLDELEQAHRDDRLWWCREPGLDD